MEEALNPDRQIAEKLHRFSRQLKRCNGQGLLDLARQSEDVVCRLLNLALGWDLVGQFYCFEIDRGGDGTEKHDCTLLCKNISAQKYAAELAEKPLSISIFEWQ